MMRVVLTAREVCRKMLEIHTKSWDPPLPAEACDELAELTVGYCGADIKVPAAVRGLEGRACPSPLTFFFGRY